MANKKIPMRKCVGCQEMKEKKSLIRVVKTAEGDIILDDTGKKNGRGAYICKSLECFKKAKKTKALERSLGVSVHWSRLAARICDCLERFEDRRMI